jgi:hypothetical protein
MSLRKCYPASKFQKETICRHYSDKISADKIDGMSAS